VTLLVWVLLAWMAARAALALVLLIVGVWLNNGEDQ